MAAAAAVAQAQAVQYANRFVELQGAVDSGDLGAARKALSAFQKESVVSAAMGLDPLSQASSLRREFASVRKALLRGDISTAQAGFSNLRKELGLPQSQLRRGGSRGDSGSAVLASEEQGLTVIDEASSKPGLASRRDAVSVSPAKVGFGATAAGADVRTRAEQPPTGVADEELAGETVIRTQAALTPFNQSPQVFPTSTASEARMTIPPVNTSTQAVLQGLAATQPDAQLRDLDGTPFAPTPELLLGTKGMSIPAGAQLRFANNPILLQTIAFRII